MCGIAGIISRDNKLDTSRSLRLMADALKHRGPDDNGYFEGAEGIGYYVGLAHRRLSIIDIGTGKQPIANEDGTIYLVFNGEIYNYLELREQLLGKGHVFRTSSDSEVIVHAYEEYGEECLAQFRGMFAFAIWDCSEESLFLARDRYGKKPLFYKLSDDTLLFSSEVKSFIALDEYRVEVNEQAIRDYIVYRYVPGPETLYKDIYKLEPGSYATYKNGVFEKTRYYIPPDKYELTRKPTCTEQVSGFLQILRESVKLRMISDVPFGAFLSGGIDSSAIVSLMTEFSDLPIKTFSVGFKESEYSELKYAEVIARHFKTDHHELVVSHEELINHLPELVRFRDAPVSEPSDIPIYLLAKEASKTVKMVLTGEGSDEVLAGYPKHLFERYGEYYRRIPGALRRHVIEPMVNSLPYKFRRAKTAISTLGIDSDMERQPRWFGAMSYDDARKLLVTDGNIGQRAAPQNPFDVDLNSSALRKILFFDQLSWLPDNLLERGDRMTMAASIEARMPFMDHKLIEYVSALPDDCRIRGRTTKWLLREAMKSVIPQGILDRPKVGFRLPVNEWFKGPMKEYLYENLLGVDSLSRHYYRKKPLERILKEHSDGHQNHEKALWTMLNLEIWLKQNH